MRKSIQAHSTREIPSKRPLISNNIVRGYPVHRTASFWELMFRRFAFQQKDATLYPQRCQQNCAIVSHASKNILSEYRIPIPRRREIENYEPPFKDYHNAPSELPGHCLFYFFPSLFLIRIGAFSLRWTLLLSPRVVNFLHIKKPSEKKKIEERYFELDEAWRKSPVETACGFGKCAVWRLLQACKWWAFNCFLGILPFRAAAWH